MSSSAVKVEALNEFVAIATTTGDEDREKNLPMRKRKKGQELSALSGSSLPVYADDAGIKKRVIQTTEEDGMGIKSDSDDGTSLAGPSEAQTMAGTDDLKPIRRQHMSKAREVRLEQNRKAARESRRRKKVMIEELQRSVIFFSRANGTLKQQNEELQRLLVQAQTQVQSIQHNPNTVSGMPGASNQSNDGGQQPVATGQVSAPTTGGNSGVDPGGTGSGLDPSNAQQAVTVAQQAQAQAAQAATQLQFQNMAQVHAAQTAAAQAMYESQGFPAAAARVAAQSIMTGAAAAAAGSAPAPSPANNNAPADANAQAAATMAANPFMAAMMGMGMPPGAAVPASVPGAAAPGPGITPNPMDTLNQFAMQQQFAAQLNAMGGAVPGMPNMAAANPAIFQQQAAAMQLAAASGQWVAAPSVAPGAQAQQM